MYKIISIFLFLLACLAYAASANDKVIGNWYSEDKEAKIEIYKEVDKFFGKIVWLKESKNAEGKDKTDKNNPDEAKRSKKIVGMKMLWDFVYDEDNVWEDGKIYDAKSGKTYSCKMTLSEDGDTLEVRGYIGFSMFGRTAVWTRAK
jgi:uncharacterized protein (DUF2147 family)